MESHIIKIDVGDITYQSELILDILNHYLLRSKMSRIKFVLRHFVPQDSMDDSERSEESRTYNLLALLVLVNYVLI